MGSVTDVGARVVSVLERQRWLDPLGYKLEHGLALTFNLLGRRSRTVQDALHGKWLGHPLHPVLTDVPVGAWTTAVVLDGLALTSDRPDVFERAAQAAVGLGVLGGVGAALSGLTDWQHTQDAARRSGLVHGAVNVVALVLNLRSFQDRRRSRHARAVVESALGYGLVLASSYLGGDLVFRHRVGVAHGPDRDGPAEFTAVLADEHLLEGAPRRVECGGVAAVLVRHAGRISAVGEQCSHLGAPMEQGWLYRGELVCPWHGSRFDLSTGCPSTGPATAPLAGYETRVRDGQIELRDIGLAPTATLPSQPPTATRPA